MTALDKHIQISGDDFMKMSEYISPVFENAKRGNPPEFVLIMGGVGAGKTTQRRNLFKEGYVHLEFGEIFMNIRKMFDRGSDKIADYCTFAFHTLLSGSLEQKKNIVTEIIGADYDTVAPLIRSMKAEGYEISVQLVECDLAEAYQRHLDAVNTDPNYISAAHTEEATLDIFSSVLATRAS